MKIRYTGFELFLTIDVLGLRGTHRHLREIDCSLAVVGGLVLNLGANQYTDTACGAKKCFVVAAVAGNITTTVNKGRQAGPMSSLLFLDVFGGIEPS